MFRSNNKQFAIYRILVLSLCLVYAFVADLSAQEFKAVHDGVEYAELAREIAGRPVRMNLLRLDLKKVRLDIVHAADAAIGVEKTSVIATHHKAVAAINAGFFRLDRSAYLGDPAGLFVVDGKLLSEAVPGRISLWINEVDRTTLVRMSRESIVGRIRIGDYVRQLTGINRELKQSDLVLYTPEFGPSTMTNNEGVEIIVDGNRITSISMRRGNSTIPRNGFVLAAAGEYKDSFAGRRIGERFSFGTQLQNPAAPEVNKANTKLTGDIVSGVPQLIRAGNIAITWEQEHTSKAFVETRHPRTAVANLKDGKFLMITVDGRSESSGGIGLYDLADLLLEFGAVDAMNLDGGGSTTMYLDGKVVNHPSDKEGERKVSDALLVTLRNKKVSRK